MQHSQHGVHVLATTVGFLALATLWLGVVLGVVLRDGLALDRIRPATLAALHRTVVSCGLTLVIVHASIQLAVGEMGVRVVDLFIPFLNDSEPLGIGLGTLGMVVMFLVVLLVALRKLSGYHRWRALHRLGYVAFALALGHVRVLGVERYPAIVIGPIVVVGVVTLVVAVARAGWAFHAPRSVRDLWEMGPWAKRAVIQVDATRCVHFGFCQHEAPELFELREDGRLVHAPSARASEIDAAIRAARACPSRAIMLKNAGRVVLARADDEPTSSRETSDDPASAERTGPGDGSTDHVAA